MRSMWEADQYFDIDMDTRGRGRALLMVRLWSCTRLAGVSRTRLVAGPVAHALAADEVDVLWARAVARTDCRVVTAGGQP